jgi:hypothetical protein
MLTLWGNQETSSFRCRDHGLGDRPDNGSGSLCKQGGWQGRQAAGSRSAEQLPQKMQMAGMLAKGDERDGKKLSGAAKRSLYKGRLSRRDKAPLPRKK